MATEVIDLLNAKAKLFLASKFIPSVHAKYAKKRPEVVLRRLRHIAFHAAAGTESPAIEFPEEVAAAVLAVRADERVMDALNAPTLAS